MRKRLFLSALFLSCIFCLPAVQAATLEAPFDHSAWEQFLSKYVNKDGEVNYTAAQKDQALLDQYLTQIKQINWDQFYYDWPREERLALMLNAYHAGLVKLILKHYPITNTQKVPGFWQMDAIFIGKRHFSLNAFRKDEIMKTYRDEKIHTVLSYAAKSSPRFPVKAFTGATVDAQLYLSARTFMNEPGFHKIEPGQKKIWLSKIFEWHALDFTLNYGAFENDRDLSEKDHAILSFAAHYLEDPAKVRFLENEKYKIKYLPFDWTLNDWKSGEVQSPSKVPAAA